MPPVLSEPLDAIYLDVTRPAADAVRRRRGARIVVVTAPGRGTEWQDKAGLVSAFMAIVYLLNDKHPTV